MNLQRKASSTDGNQIELHPVEPYQASWTGDTYEEACNVVIDAEERCEDWDFVRYRATLSDGRKPRFHGLNTCRKNRGDVVYLFDRDRGTWPAIKNKTINHV